MARTDSQPRLVPNILLTGLPGWGKTTVIMCTVEGFEGQAGGFYTQEIRECGRRVGFGIKTLDGQSGILAHTDLSHGPKISKYRVNIGDIEQIAVPALQQAGQEADLIICDEIAGMELCSERFKTAVWAALDCSTPLLGTIQRKRHPFLDKIRQLDTVRIVEVRPDNRDELPGQLRGLIGAMSAESSR